jgi:cobalt ECF transporter T component CbiQ
MATAKIPSFLLEHSLAARIDDGAGARLSIINKGIEKFATVMNAGFIQYELAGRRGFLQDLDARVKIFFLLFFAVLISLKNTFAAELLIAAFLLLLAMASRLNLATHYKKVIFLGFAFGFLISIPSALNLVSKGTVILPLIHLSQSHQFWIYRIPEVIGFTREGLLGVAMLTMRVMNSLAVSFLVIYTTPFLELVRALKVMRVPDIFLMTFALAYRYIFIFAETIHDMHLAKKARQIGSEKDMDTRRWLAGRMAFMFRKSQHRCEEIFKAMQQRSSSGSISLQGRGPMTRKDWIKGFLLLSAGIILLTI